MREHRASYRPLPGNIPGGVVVCIARMSAADTPKLGLGFAIAFVDQATRRARPAGVAWIDGNHGNTGLFRLVFDERTQLSETPIVQSIPLRFVGLNPSSDMRQIFERNSERVAFSFGNDCLADYVILMFLIPRLLAAHFLQSAFGGFSADSLQDSAALGVSRPIGFDFCAVVSFAHAVNGNVHNAHVDAKNAFRRQQFWIVEVADAAHVPLAANEHQIDFAFAMLQQFALPLAGDTSNRFASTQEPNRNGLIGFKAKDSVVVRLRGMLAKRAFCGLVDFIGVGDFFNALYRGLRGQLEALAQWVITRCLERVLSKRFCLPSLLRQPIARIVTALKRGAQDTGLSGSGSEFHVSNQFHCSSIEGISFMSRPNAVLWTALYPSPWLKPGDSRAFR